MPRFQIKPGGINICYDPVFGAVETHTSTCNHCQSITEFPTRKAMMEYVDICRSCMKLICVRCVGQGCRPYEQEAERQEKEYRIKSRIHLTGWGCY